MFARRKITGKFLDFVWQKSEEVSDIFAKLKKSRFAKIILFFLPVAAASCGRS